MNNIILISGKAEHGKTETAKILKQELKDHGYRAAIIPYGDYVKSSAKLIFDWDGQKDEKGRNLLQHWGTDVVRAKCPDFWVESVQRLVLVAQSQLDYVIIDDCRFPNEIEAWKNWPHISVRVERPGYINHLTDDQRCHPSETSLDDYEFDITLHAIDVNELGYEVRTKLAPYI